MEKIIFLAVTYPYGIISGLVFKVFCTLKIIRVLYKERFPVRQRGLILVSNHPSLLEPLLLPALFFREYLSHPFKFAPWSTPDKRNFYDRWYWFWLRARAIPINRGDVRSESKALFQMRTILNSGGRIIYFAEGGRTFKGKSFLYSKKEKRIRELKKGIGWLALKTNATVLPVWMEGTDEILPNVPGKLFSWPKFRNRITIKIGQPLRFQHRSPYLNKEQVTQIIANALLNLADEEE